LKAVEEAKERVWLLGVAFSETIDIHSLFPLLIQQVGQIDIRILLLDPFRSPAIFRTLIESKQDTVYKIIQTDRTSSSAIDPFYKHPLYRAFNAAYEMLNEDDRLKPFVRFYGHNPNCWLVLVDKAVYYQPYTLGRKGPARSGNRCIGAEMPIFKFEQGVTPSTFEVLYDHTDKLWKTTNVDLFHMESRRANRMRILKDIFERRAVWLKHVYTMLYDQRNDRSMNIRPRRFPRRPCEAGRLTLSIKWEDGGQKNIIRIKEIRDCSYEGMQVQLESPTPLLRKEIVVGIDGIGAVRSPVAAQMLRSLSDRCNNRFSVVWTDDQNTLAGLRVVAVT